MTNFKILFKHSVPKIVCDLCHIGENAFSDFEDGYIDLKILLKTPQQEIVKKYE